MIQLLALHVLVFLVAAFVFYHLFLRSARMRARFRLYEVRDRLILLVARQQLAEESQVFRHCYGRVNELLAAMPDVGVDDILEVVLSRRKNEDFDHALMQARARLARISQDDALTDDDVKSVVRDYFAAVEYSILTHSRWMRVFFLLSTYATRQVAESMLQRLAPVQARHVVEGAQVFHDAELGLQP
ncbi:MAG: hypothetical protein KF871_14605 [Hydrogenophaga sp.]|uniref:hypothetical protein n=1 Tax=Hydrogenophaga sp. TaxID=1904254 RepID=UPI001D20823C|nr:hypothetical protein [Hydrogenophaga sp.]MBX3611119.1 hypothetical protein [Hydrogenophaga sp.]